MCLGMKGGRGGRWGVGVSWWWLVVAGGWWLVVAGYLVVLFTLWRRFAPFRSRLGNARYSKRSVCGSVRCAEAFGVRKCSVCGTVRCAGAFGVRERSVCG